MATLNGRWTTLSRPQKSGVVLGALLLLSGLVGAGTSLVSSSLSSDAGTTRSRGAGAGVQDAPQPSLILPTDAPALPEPTASASSASPTPSGHPGATEDPGSSASPTSTARPGGAMVSGPARGPAPADYSAWVGHGCPSGTYGGYAEYGRYSDGMEGWYTVDQGGYDGGSCDGSFAAVPMSGSRTQDHDNGALWWWSVGRAYDTCAIGVFVPSGDSTDVGGDPTTYRVLSDPQDESSAYATFQIDQRANRGRLVDAGTYRVQDGRIAVRLLDRGQDWNDNGPTYTHHAAAQMRITCGAGAS
ncbi:adhesin [Streptomyces sp. NPDC046197]|uniref:adhesin n=1 Tax=Streptomyces sp. NPDC046197 TaxID=3154337 RepID=UPI0033F2D000